VRHYRGARDRLLPSSLSLSIDAHFVPSISSSHLPAGRLIEFFLLSADHALCLSGEGVQHVEGPQRQWPPQRWLLFCARETRQGDTSHGRRKGGPSSPPREPRPGDTSHLYSRSVIPEPARIEVDQILFIPLEPSCTNFDNLMEQTSHLVSLVRSSVHRLPQLDLLRQSIARFSDAPQFSGLVSISFWIPKYELCIIIFLN
jgi:hypothetical protein